MGVQSMSKTQVNFCINVFDTEQTKKIKTYKTEKIAKRYIDQWLKKSGHNYCRVYSFTQEKWFTYYTA